MVFFSIFLKIYLHVALSNLLITQSKLASLILFILSFSIMGVTAYIYENSTQFITQNIMDVASITLKNTDLGPLKEGETKNYTKNDIPSLGDAIIVTVDESVSLVNLNLDSDLDLLDEFYSTYDIVVKFSEVVGNTYSVGDVACTLSVGAEDYSSIELAEAGTWKFDFEVTTTAKSVDMEIPGVITLIIEAESE
jgi:hypothetical protein